AVCYSLSGGQVSWGFGGVESSEWTEGAISRNGRGITTPPETMILTASSTESLVASTWLDGRKNTNPVVGLGVVGRNTETSRVPSASVVSLVTNPRARIPGRGYSNVTTRLKPFPSGLVNVSMISLLEP